MGIKRRRGDEELDARDLEICRLLDSGLSMPEISQVMHVSPVAVSAMRSALREIDAEDRR